MYIKSHLIGSHGAIGLQTMRFGGVSPYPEKALNFGDNVGDDPKNVRKNLALFSKKINIKPEKIVPIHQIHGDNVLVHRTNTKPFSEADALISNQKGFFISVKTADCFPLLLLDTKQKACGAIHAGWKGVQKNIVRATINKMKEAYNTQPKNLIAWIGAGISADVYEVSGEVQEQFDPQYSKPSKNEGHFYLDLRTCIFEQFLEEGISLKNIEVADYCTYKNNDLFFSHRKEKGKTGRLMSGICLQD